MTANTEAVDLFAFDNSYARLPGRFFARLRPTPVATPRLVRLNQKLARHLGLDPGKLATPEGVGDPRRKPYAHASNRSPWLMLATSSGPSYLNSVMDGPSFSVRLSIATACAVTSSSRDRAGRPFPAGRRTRGTRACPTRIHHQRGRQRSGSRRPERWLL